MIELQAVSYGYTYKRERRCVLRELSHSFRAGSCCVVAGPSGSGKTTLLTLLAGFEKPDSGRILINGVPLDTLDGNAYRAKTIGVIFQNYNLLAQLTAAENVQLALRLGGFPDTRAAALKLLDGLGINEALADHRAPLLSGGEQQRVAIARALACEPEILLADEPTGNLDPENARNILDIFLRLAHEDGKCVIISSHSDELIAAADDVLYLTPR